MHHHTAQLPNNQMAPHQTMHSQHDMPQQQQQMDYHSNYYNAQCNQQSYYQQDGFPDQASPHSSYGQWNSGAPPQQPEYPCQQPAEPSPPGSNWAYPSTYSEDLCRAAEFPSWLKQEPLDSCDTGGNYC
uniref:Uncharacterized protein n=1 Tax=Rhipicephalus zambeziensis TaxID=60191 RepID=A0A224YZR3_9ACAR